MYKQSTHIDINAKKIESGDQLIIRNLSVAEAGWFTEHGMWVVVTRLDGRLSSRFIRQNWKLKLNKSQKAALPFKIEDFRQPGGFFQYHVLSPFSAFTNMNVYAPNNQKFCDSIHNTIISGFKKAMPSKDVWILKKDFEYKIKVLNQWLYLKYSAQADDYRLTGLGMDVRYTYNNANGFNVLPASRHFTSHPILEYLVMTYDWHNLHHDLVARA